MIMRYRPRSIVGIYIFYLGLVLNNAPWISSASAENQGAGLRVVVKPSRTDVRIKEPFEVALRVENPTETNQTVQVMSCSWFEHWKSNDTNVTTLGWTCAKNLPVSIAIAPGGACTNQLQMLIAEPTAGQKLIFRMGFTPIGSQKTFWSDDVQLRILPPDTWRRGTAIYRDRNHDGKIDWEVSGEKWRSDGSDVYKVDTNADGFYDTEYSFGYGIAGKPTTYRSKNIHERVPVVGNNFIIIEKPSWVE